MLDNNEVRVGDILYDILLGPCRVVAVSKDGSFRVKSQSSEISISPGGFLGRTRRVYWENPIVIIPRKNDQAFKMVKNVTMGMYKELLRDTWGFVDEETTEKD